MITLTGTLQKFNEPRIHFHDLGELAPKDDITPLEAVHLAMMLSMATVGSHIDHVKYAYLHGLTRHFTGTLESKT